MGRGGDCSLCPGERHEAGAGTAARRARSPSQARELRSQLPARTHPLTVVDPVGRPVVSERPDSRPGSADSYNPTRL